MSIERDRLVGAAAQGQEPSLDRALRPTRLADYIGQRPVREQMDILSAPRALAARPSITP